MKQKVILEEEDLFILLRFGKIELADQGVDVVLQRSNQRPVIEKEIGEFGTGSFHTIVPVEIGREFTSVFLVPAARRNEKADESDESRRSSKDVQRRYL